MPFTTMMIGRYGDHSLSVAIYAANMALIALVSLRLDGIAERDGWNAEGEDDGTGALWLLIASALLSVAISFYDPGWSMLAYLLNFLSPLVTRKR
jgi:uncharacterized membrane protein